MAAEPHGLVVPPVPPSRVESPAESLASPALPATRTDSGWPARLELGFERRAQGAVLATRRHSGPLRVQKALYPEGPELAHVHIVHPPGGIAGGDRLAIDVTVGAEASALLTTPGATKWYKANGVPASQAVTLAVGEGAALEWLPQENIFFNAVQACMDLRIECTASGRFCGWEVSVLGRRASAERFDAGRVRQRFEIVRDGQLLWAERGLIEGGDGLLDAPIGWDGRHVAGMLWALGPAGAGFDEDLVAHVRAAAAVAADQFGGAAADAAPHGGITVFPHGLLVARVLGGVPEQVRSVLRSVWICLRPALFARAAVAPRIWAT